MDAWLAMAFDDDGDQIISVHRTAEGAARAVADDLKEAIAGFSEPLTDDEHAAIVRSLAEGDGDSRNLDFSSHDAGHVLTSARHSAISYMLNLRAGDGEFYAYGIKRFDLLD